MSRRLNPIVGALHYRHIWFGVARIYWAIGILIAFFCIKFLQMPVLAFLGLVPVWVGRLLTRIDVDIPKIYGQYQKQGDFYTHLNAGYATTNLRPVGFRRTE
jgi:hypothetical protein